MSVLSDIVEEEINMEMTPMIDVTFLLLIFFLLTLKFKVLEGKLMAYLPKDVGVNSSPAEPKEKVEIIISIPSGKTGSKVYAADPNKGAAWQGETDRRFEFVGREPVYQIGPRRTKKVDELARWLKDLYRKDPEAPTTIDCRKGTVYGDMVPVLDAAVAANFEKITFVGEYK